MLKRKFPASLPILAVLLSGGLLVLLLADPTLQADPADWMATARNLVQQGDTGFQHRNILFAYVLALPMALGMNPVWFGVAFSGLSLLISAFLLYRISIRFVSTGFAAYTSLLFIFSWPFLRYGTQVFTDVPAVACLMAMVFFHFRYLDHRQPGDLLLGDFAAGLAVSLRYASAFTLIAFLYFLWITRRAYKWHLLGVSIALVPYLPQLLFNVRHLGHPLALSYAAMHPILNWSYFREEFGNGVRYQLLHYIRYLFFDFRGLFAVLTPFCVWGAMRSGQVIGRPKNAYLGSFFAGYLGFLSFYSFFSNRYLMPALIPCFIWLAVGIARLDARLSPGSFARRFGYPAVLFLVAYGIFDVNVQLVQSSRTLHITRTRVIEALDGIARDQDFVVTPPNMQGYVLRQARVHYEVIGVSTLVPADLARLEGRRAYVLWAPRLWIAEGANWNLSVDAVRERLTPVKTMRSPAIIELLLFRFLRLVGRESFIPSEEWVIFQVISS